MNELERALLEKWRADILEEQVKIRKALERLSPPTGDNGVLVYLDLPGSGEEISYHIVIKNSLGSSTVEVEDDD